MSYINFSQIDNTVGICEALPNLRAAAPGVRVTNSEMRKSLAVMCWFGLDVRLFS